jgi:hypothetical protein
MGHLSGMLTVDAQRRALAAERRATEPSPLEVAVYNRCIKTLSRLDDPAKALGVTEKLTRSIREHMAVSAR